MSSTEKITPMMKQYLEVKCNHEDCILMFRLGDFYEKSDRSHVVL